jgi:hypothetical protein
LLVTEPPGEPTDQTLNAEIATDVTNQPLCERINISLEEKGEGEIYVESKEDYCNKNFR